MFKSQIAVLSISTNQIIAELVNPNQGFKTTQRATYAWNPDTVLKVVNEIALEFKTKTFRVILDENFAYVLAATSLERISNRQAALALIQDRVPEDMDQNLWGYRIAPLDSNLIQFIVLTSYISKVLRTLSTQLDLTFELIQPQSVAIGQAVSQKIPSFLMLHQDDLGMVGLVVSSGQVLISKELTKPATDSDLDELISYADKRYGFSAQELVISEQVNLKEMAWAEQLHVSKWQESIAAGLAKMKSGKGRPGTLPIALNVNQQTSLFLWSSKHVFLVGLALVGVVVGVAAALLMFK